jgi:hypothetical protein
MDPIPRKIPGQRARNFLRADGGSYGQCTWKRTAEQEAGTNR